MSGNCGSTSVRLTVGWNEIFLQVLGVWPNLNDREEEFVSWKFLKFRPLIIALLIAVFICLPQTTFLLTVKVDMDIAIDNLVLCTLPSTVSLVKILIFWTKQEGFLFQDVGLLLTLIARNWTSVKDEEELQRMTKNAETGRALIKRIILFTCTLNFLYLGQHLHSQVSRDMSNMTDDTDNGRDLLFASYFPCNTRVSPNFELVTACQYCSVLLAATIYMSADNFVTVLILHARGQLANLRLDLETLVPEENPPDKAVFQKKAAGIARKHEEIIRFATNIESIFNVMFLVQIVACTVMMSLQGFQLFTSMTNPETRVTVSKFGVYLLFSAFVLGLLCFYCYVGEEIQKESIAVARAAYNCAWYNLSSTQTKTLLFIMVRGSKPLCLTAGNFCELNMATFSTILRTSLSYLSVLLAMKV